MGKKNSKDQVASSSKHKHPKSSGRPPGKTFTGHKGRGKDLTGQSIADIPGVHDRPESAVDEVEEDDDEDGSSEGESCRLARSNFAHLDP